MQWIERGFELCDQLTTEDKFYSQVCLILDFEGFEYRQLASKQFISMALELIKMFEANYPEVLRCIWAINAPAIFNIFWGIIKPFMSERTTSKIRIFGSNKNKWRTDILAMIDEDNIPSLYSGANTSCPDYNIESDVDIKKLSPSFRVFPLEDMKKVNVGAGQVHTVEVKASYGTQIHWNFCTDKRDITFRVEYEDVEDIIEPCRVDSHLCIQKGKINCEKSGMYTLVFDNSYSSYTGKSLRYIVWTS
jgi:metal transporter CNNM